MGVAEDHGRPSGRRSPDQLPRPTLLTESSLQLRAREAKRALLTVARRARWVTRPAEFATPTLATDPNSTSPVIEHRVPIDRTDPHAHPVFEHGKRHNVRLAATAFDGLELTPERTFSFWRTLGPTTAARGFTAGMELRGGCMIPSIGGGLCLLSNALFQVALLADFVIVERYSHTLVAVPPADDEVWGTDATVAFAHIDLRFRPRAGRWVLRCAVRDSHLVVSLGTTVPSQPVPPWPVPAITLRSVDHHVVRTRTGNVHVGTLVRDRTNARGETVTEHVATDRKRLLTDRELGRNCMTCGETSCVAREEQLALIAPERRS